MTAGMTPDERLRSVASIIASLAADGPAPNEWDRFRDEAIRAGLNPERTMRVLQDVTAIAVDAPLLDTTALGELAYELLRCS